MGRRGRRAGLFYGPAAPWRAQGAQGAQGGPGLAWPGLPSPLQPARARAPFHMLRLRLRAGGGPLAARAGKGAGGLAG